MGKLCTGSKARGFGDSAAVCVETRRERFSEALSTQRGISCMSADGMQFVSMGQHGFLATDAAASCGVGFLGGRFLKDKNHFEECVAPLLRSLTSVARHWRSAGFPGRRKRFARPEESIS